jgi:hypothetical protein
MWNPNLSLADEFFTHAVQRFGGVMKWGIFGTELHKKYNCSDLHNCCYEAGQPPFHKPHVICRSHLLSE